MSLPLNKIICGHVIDVLKPFPGDSIDSIITSFPYWGLRSYGAECVQVWGGQPGCDHEWVDVKEDVEGYSSKKRWQHGANGRGEETIIRREHPEYWTHDVRQYSWCAKCGAWRGELGLEPVPGDYVQHVAQVCDELMRVLKPTGSMWLNLGDTYYSHTSSRSAIRGSPYEGRNALMSEDRPLVIQEHGWLQMKQLLGLPERIMIALQDRGWILRNKLIWNKSNAMPSSVYDRLTCCHEVFFYFIKQTETQFWKNGQDDSTVTEKPVQKYIHKKTGEIRETMPRRGRPEDKDWFTETNLVNFDLMWRGYSNYFDLDSIRQPFKTSSLIRLSQDLTNQNGGEKVADYQDPEKIISASHTKHTPSIHKRMARDLSKYNTPDAKRMSSPRARIAVDGVEDESYFYHPGGKNPGDVWTISTKPFMDAHFATFPTDLVKPILKASCPRGGVVLDPFMGSGTVALVAHQLGRSYIGIDAVPSYCEMARKRIKSEKYRKLKDGEKTLIEF